VSGRGIAGISILHVITRLDRGGSAEVVLELARLLAEHGARVGIVVGRTVEPQVELDSFRSRTGIPVFTVPRLIRKVSPLSDIGAFIGIWRVIRRVRPDIVHTHTSKAGIIGRFAAKLSGVGCIVHTPHGHVFYGYYDPLWTSFFIFLERLAARVTDRITVLTERGRRDHVERKIGSGSLFTVIPSGIDVERFSGGNGDAFRRELGVNDEMLVGWVGRLVGVKDCRNFITAASLVRERCRHGVRFVVVGDGEERETLEEYSRELGVHDSLVFTGNRTDIPDVMAALDVFVLSSLNEGFGRVLVEAMAAGTAVVSTMVGGTVDVVEDGVSGILVPPSDSEALADAVLRVIETPGLMERLKEAGRRRAWLFDMSVVVSKFEELYAELLGL